jgi:HEPN domain-containing protein
MDKAIIAIIKKLKEKERNDLADLLTGCKSEIEETDQYGSYWNKFLSSFAILAPVEKYQRLEKLSEEDRSMILQIIQELYPKSEDLEIGFLNFKILANENALKENKELANDWLKRAKNKMDEGKQSVEKWHFAEAISAFQECIELSLKAISLFLIEKYPRDHKFDEKEFKEVLDRIPENLKSFEFYKLYLYSKFWGNFYTISKYGLENFGIGANKLFGKEEAELAQKHADKCYFASMQLKNYLEHPW